MKVSFTLDLRDSSSHKLYFLHGKQSEQTPRNVSFVEYNPTALSRFKLNFAFQTSPTATSLVFHPSTSSLFISDPANGVSQFDLQGKPLGNWPMPGTADGPQHLCVLQEDLYIATSTRIYQHTPPFSLAPTLVDVGPFGFGAIGGLAACVIKGNRYLIASDSSNHVIRQICLTNPSCTLTWGSGQRGSENAPVTSFNWPAAVAVRNSGSIFVCEPFVNTIRKLGENGVTTALRPYRPCAIIFDELLGAVFLADEESNSMRVIDARHSPGAQKHDLDSIQFESTTVFTSDSAPSHPSGAILAQPASASAVDLHSPSGSPVLTPQLRRRRLLGGEIPNLLPKPLGGGLCKVYRTDDGKYAVKVYPFPPFEAFRNTNISREIDLVMNCNSPRIVKFVNWYSLDPRVEIDRTHLNFSEFQNQTCLMLEYHPWTLDEYPRVTFDMAVRVALDIAQGLDYLHTNKYLHRDIKPSNVLLTEGRCPRAVLADFGFSKPEDSSESGQGGVGTVRYRAPETYSDPPTYTQAADIFSFGMTLYAFICGTPFNKLMPEVITTKIRTRVRPLIPPDCPTLFDVLIRQCWDPNPKDRPTAAQLVANLSAINPASRCRIETEEKLVV